MSERWRIEPEYAIKVDPTLGILGVLLEPATVVAKALGTGDVYWSEVLLGATYDFSNRGRSDRTAGCFICKNAWFGCACARQG